MMAPAGEDMPVGAGELQANVITRACILGENAEAGAPCSARLYLRQQFAPTALANAR